MLATMSTSLDGAEPAHSCPSEAPRHWAQMAACGFLEHRCGCRLRLCHYISSIPTSYSKFAPTVKRDQILPIILDKANSVEESGLHSPARCPAATLYDLMVIRCTELTGETCTRRSSILSLPPNGSYVGAPMLVGYGMTAL